MPILVCAPMDSGMCMLLLAKKQIAEQTNMSVNNRLQAFKYD